MGGFNGSGTYIRYYNWQNDANAAINITASRVDTEDSGFATGLSNCITKDGQQTITANLPMATFRHTGVGNGVAATDYAALGQVQSGLVGWAVAGGAADVITATYSPAITSLVDGMIVGLRALAANATTTPTFSPNSLTAHTITQTGGNALIAGSIAGQYHEVLLRYNLANTRWEILNPVYAQQSLAAYALINSQAFTGTPSLPTGATGVTQTAGDSSTKFATTAFVGTAITNAVVGSVVGTIRNAKMSVTSASATATFTADEIVIETALGGTTKKLSSYSQSINLGTTGAGGMDTGAAPVSGYVSLYAIAKADGTTSILACAIATSTASIYGGGNMPSGYTFSALIGIWPTDGSSRFVVAIQLDRKIYRQAVTVVNTTGSTSYSSAVDLSTAIPSSAKTYSGYAGSTTSAGNNTIVIAADTNGTAKQLCSSTSASSAIDSMQGAGTFTDLPCIAAVSAALFWKAGNSNNVTIAITAYTF